MKNGLYCTCCKGHNKSGQELKEDRKFGGENWELTGQWIQGG